MQDWQKWFSGDRKSVVAGFPCLFWNLGQFWVTWWLSLSALFCSGVIFFRLDINARLDIDFCKRLIQIGHFLKPN